jgi:hypothetical protein
MSGTLRPIVPLPFPKTKRSDVTDDLPKFRTIDPKQLLVEPGYQRNLSERSMRLIARMIEHWDWSSMKPPVCATQEDGKLVVIDGQHTAIAAASHGRIPTIPIIVVKTSNLRDRAQAFVRHNVDRVQLTHVQIHHALVAAGDEVALAVSEACRKAGVIVRRSNPSCGAWGRNETVAIGSLMQVATRKGVTGLGRVLKILTNARRTPIAALEVRAVAEVLFNAELRGKVTDFDLVTVIRRRTPDGWADFAKHRGKKQSIPAFRALASWWARAGADE